MAAAKKEGTLTTIALPRDWCGYGAVIDGFKAKYGLVQRVMSAFRMREPTVLRLREKAD